MANYGFASQTFSFNLVRMNNTGFKQQFMFKTFSWIIKFKFKHLFRKRLQKQQFLSCLIGRLCHSRFGELYPHGVRAPYTETCQLFFHLNMTPKLYSH